MPASDHRPHIEQSAELKALLAAQRPTPRWLSRLRFWLRGLFAVTLLAFAPIAEAAPLDLDRLIPALVQVESNGNPRAVGDNGKALGQLQIWSVVVVDVNRAHGTRYTHADAFDPAKAEAICRAYLSIYATPRRLGRSPTMEDAARIWNGGPNGHRKSATEKYWHKVARVL
jgi:hypothetical protein